MFKELFTESAWKLEDDKWTWRNKDYTREGYVDYHNDIRKIHLLVVMSDEDAMTINHKDLPKDATSGQVSENSVGFNIYSKDIKVINKALKVFGMPSIQSI